MALVQKNNGANNGVTNLVPTLGLATTAGNAIILMVSSAGTIATPAGFTSRSPQVNIQGCYFFDKLVASGNSTDTPTMVQGGLFNGTWFIAEYSGITAFKTSNGSNATGVANGSMGASPALTPTAGATLIIAYLGISAGSTSVTYTAGNPTSWTNSFIGENSLQLAGTATAGRDSMANGWATLQVTADGVATYSTAASASVSGGTNNPHRIIVAYAHSTGLTRTNTVATSAAGVATTAVTATITANSLCLITMSFENNDANAADAATPITVSGTAMSWTKVNDNSPVNNGTRCAVRQYAAYSSGAGSRTFTHTKGNTAITNRRMMVSVIEGANTTLSLAIPAGNRFNTQTGTTNASQSITPAGVGSMIIGGIGDWSATNSYVAIASNTLGTVHHVAGAYTGITVEPTTQPLASASAFTWGATTTAGAVTYAVVEIVPAGGAAATSLPPFGMRRRFITRRINR